MPGEGATDDERTRTYRHDEIDPNALLTEACLQLCSYDIN
jgi:hypothetical protein